MQTCGNHPKAFGTLLQFPALHPSWRLRQSQCWRIRVKQHGRPGMMPLWQTARGALIEMTTRFYAFFVFNILVCNLCLCVFISFHFSGLSSLKALPLRQPFSAWWISLCSNTCASWMNCEIAACPESRTFRHRSYVTAWLLPKSSWDTWKQDPQYIYLRVFEHKIWNDSTIDNTFNRWWRGRPHISIFHVFHVFHARFCVRNVEMLWCSKSRWPSSKVPFTPFTPFELTSFWGPWVERRVGEIRSTKQVPDHCNNDSVTSIQ